MMGLYANARRADDAPWLVDELVPSVAAVDMTPPRGLTAIRRNDQGAPQIPADFIEAEGPKLAQPMHSAKDRFLALPARSRGRS